jgi:hypothetical protein
MESITRFITHKLKLKVNEAKSAVARPQKRKFSRVQLYRRSGDPTHNRAESSATV